MQTIRDRGLLVCGCLFALFLASGCFQAAGDTMPATGVAQGLATFTPPPSNTPFPSPSPTEAVAEPVATKPAETAISAASVLGQETGNAAAQDLNPLNLTSTAIIERATSTAAAEFTATAEAELNQFVPTSTPTVFSLETPTPFQQPIVAGADCIHEVQPGDHNLWQISRLYGVTVHEIQAATPGLTDIQIIHVGDKLVIPGCGTTGHIPPPTTVPADDTLGQGGGGSATGVCTPSSGSRVHIVRQNETLYRIALEYNVSVAELAALNCITNPGLIYIDQRLAIP